MRKRPRWTKQTARAVKLVVIACVLLSGSWLAVTLFGTTNPTVAPVVLPKSDAGTLDAPTPAPTDSLPRIRNVSEVQLPTSVSIFGEPIPLDNWEVRERFAREFYYNYVNADQIILWYKRSARYFPMIDKALSDAGLPLDMRYIPIAESGLRNITSPANADGFWQLIPGTAERYGLRVDDLIDERLDPERETKAAVAYLKFLRTQVDSWTLVAAAYNMGENNVTQALQWQHAKSYWDLYVNEQTMRYVLRIAAIKELLTHPDRYGLNLTAQRTFRTPSVRYVSVTGPIASIADWAVTQGCLYKDVKVLNPWLAGRSIPAGTYSVALPLNPEDHVSESTR